MPSLTSEQVDFIIKQADTIRDKAIISLFVDSGLRLSELVNINVNNIDLDSQLIKVKCKGGKEALAPFENKTSILLKEWLSNYQDNDRL